MGKYFSLLLRSIAAGADARDASANRCSRECYQFS